MVDHAFRLGWPEVEWLGTGAEGLVVASGAESRIGSRSSGGEVPRGFKCAFGRARPRGVSLVDREGEG